MKKINTAHLVAYIFTIYILSSFFIFSGCKPDDIDIIQPKDAVVLEIITENYSIDWVKKFGAEKGDRFGAAALTEDGDIIVVSITDTTAIEMTCSPYDKNMYGLLHLTKLDSKGNVIWKNRYDSLYRQMSGYAFFSFYSKILSSKNGYLIFLSHYPNQPCEGGVQEETPLLSSFYKFDNDGGLLWSKTISYSYTNDHTVKDYMVTEDGILYFSGRGPNNYNYKNHMFTTGKIDFDGDAIFSNNLVLLESCNTCGNAEYTKPKLTKNNEIILTAKNSDAIYFIKYDLNGVLNLEIRIAENNEEAYQSVESDVSITENGGYIINYSFYEWGVKGSGISGTQVVNNNGIVTDNDKYKDGMKFKYSEEDGDIYEINSTPWGKYLIKYNLSDEEVWKRQYITNFEPLNTGGTVSYKIPTTDGGYLLGGNANQLNEGIYQHLGSNKFYENLCLVKYSKD